MFQITTHQFSIVQSLSRVRIFATPWTAARQASLSITNSRSSLRLMSIESVMPSRHLILCRPRLFLPPIPPSITGSFPMNQLFAWGGWPTCWNFTFSISPSKEHPGLISFRMDWLDLLAVQGTLKSLLQHHSSKAPILWCSAFFIVQLSHPYMTTGKTIALTRWTFVGKVLSLFLSMLSRLDITFLPRSKRLLISWLQSPSAVILEPPKIKSATVSTISPSICHEVMGPRDSQESSPTPQFKSINCLALSLLYGSTLTSIHESWKNHSFDYTDLCWQSILLYIRWVSGQLRMWLP